jgi:regulator of RNase E activity RraA
MPTSEDLAELRSILRSAAVADAVDEAGVRTHCLPASIRALVRGPQTMIGFAMPVTTERVEAVPDEHYVGLLASLDALVADDIYVISAGGREDVALWGELLSTSCQAKGVAGVVCDGYVRDLAQVERLGFPCYGRGMVPYDINGRLEVVDHGSPVTIGDVTVRRGDLVVGDADGVVVVPPKLVDEVLAKAREKAAIEVEFVEALASGMRISEAFAKYHIL